jgi:hypothetical protein
VSDMKQPGMIAPRGRVTDAGILLIVLAALYLGCALLWQVVNRMLPDPAPPGEEPAPTRE